MNLRLRAGAIAGIGATLVMSIPMLLARRMGYVPSLPPETIVAQFGYGSAERPGTPLNQVLAAGAHLGFGAGCGALLEAAMSKLKVEQKQWPVLGMLYALGVWGASYMGWIPSFGILPPPHDDHPHRAKLMVVTHLIFGLTLGSLLRWLRSRSARRFEVAEAVGA